MTLPTKEQVNREIKLLAEWGQLGNGFSKSFRNTWYNLNLPERLEWLEKLVKEARIGRGADEGWGWYCDDCGYRLGDKDPYPDEHLTVCPKCGKDHSWGT